MRTYSEVRELTEPRKAFLERHADRLLGGHPPRAMWSCEEDGRPVVALLGFTEPHLRMSIIIDDEERKPSRSVYKLTKLFDDWAVQAGATHYGIVIPEQPDRYGELIERRGGVEYARSNGWVEYIHQIDQTLNLDDGIRPWTPSDWKPLRPLMQAFLEEHCAQGGDFLPTRNNVESFLRRGVRAASKGDPTLVLLQDRQYIGFCLWSGLPDIGLDLHERVCQGMGTYIIPEFRRHRNAKKLRAAAFKQAAVAGYTRVDGVALTPDTLASGQAAGFEASGVLVRQKIGD